MKSLFLFSLCFALFSFNLAGGQNLNPNWNAELKTSLQEFLGCNENCNRYIGQSLNMVYKVNDFYSTQQNRYMVVSEIAAFLKSSNKWTMLGPAYDQKTLTTAQEHANAKKAVVAVYLNQEGIGNVVIITPGALQPSGSWGLRVPNTASFFASQPDRSFVDKGLSFAFGKNLMKDILIYSRN